MQIDVHHHFPAPEITSAIHSLLEKVKTMSKTLDDLVTAVADQSGKVASLTAFIGGLERQVHDALTNVNLPPDAQTKVDALFASLNQNTQAISDAIDSDPATPAAANDDGAAPAEGDEVAPEAAPV